MNEVRMDTGMMDIRVKDKSKNGYRNDGYKDKGWKYISKNGYRNDG